MRCPNCGTDNIQGSDLCERCGSDLAGLDLPAAGAGFRGKLLSARVGDLELTPPLAVGPETPVADCIAKMREAHHGCVLVLEDSRLRGIFTERDVLTRVVRPRLDPATPVAKVMTPKPYTLEPGDPPVFAVHMCAVRGLRHLPVVDDGKVVGFLSVRHLLRFVLEEVIAGS